MADRSITITITGPEEVIEPSLTAFSSQYGWTETVPDPAGGEPVPNPQTREAVARNATRQFFIDVVKAYNVDRARAAAADAAAGQTDAAIDTTTMLLTVG